MWFGEAGRCAATVRRAVDSEVQAAAHCLQWAVAQLRRSSPVALESARVDKDKETLFI